jgi:dephospho-CoA kinase
MINNNIYIILLNGYPRSGKDEFVNIVSDNYTCYDHSTIDKVKNIAVQMGWSGVKDEESRIMLSELKKFYIKWFDGPFQDVLKKIANIKGMNHEKCILFIHCREPEEIERLKDYCNFDKSLNFFSILVKRPSHEIQDNKNDSDNNINNFDYDYEIINNGPIYVYKEKVLKLIEDVLHK